MACRTRSVAFSLVIFRLLCTLAITKSNFSSRLASGGEYRKVIDPASGRPTREHNWVWSPQGVIDMHRPERWGVVEFRRGGGAP